MALKSIPSPHVEFAGGVLALSGFLLSIPYTTTTQAASFHHPQFRPRDGNSSPRARGNKWGHPGGRRRREGPLPDADGRDYVT